ncbi:MAG: acyl-CoA dehydrogenase family protein [Pseudomonadota bacterium]
MEFALSDDQRMFQDSVKGFLDEAAPLDTVRKAAGGDAAIPAALSKGLTDLGATQILASEDHGGLGLGLLDAVLVQEALGAAVAPGDHLSAALALIGIASAGAAEQQAVWLPKIASGEVRFGVAVKERTGARDGAGVSSDDGKLTGKSLFALDTSQATHILVCDTEGRLHIAEASASGLTRNTLTTIDKTRDYAELVFDKVAATALAGENEPGLAADKMISAGRLLLAADTLGAAQTMLDKAVAYALERKQFNRVIGSFQSVKHLCAEMAAHLEPARALVWHAAHAKDKDMEEAEIMVLLAKSHLAEIGAFIARTATEVHGGMGFTDLLGLHYWFKRIGANRQLFGGPEQLRDEAARLQGWA